MREAKRTASFRHTASPRGNRAIIALMGAVLWTVGSAANAQEGPDEGVPLGDPIDIQSAWQSTTDYEGSAKLAYDGNTDGRYRNGSVTHTSRSDTSRPSWTADLGGVADIFAVRVWNRTDDCCRSRLSDYYVLVSDQPFESDDLDVTLADPDVFQIFRSVADSSQDFDQFPIFDSGRFVRIQLTGDDAPLSLAEVEVFGVDDPDLPRYIAPSAVTQSSTAFSAPAERARDRDVNGHFFAGSVTHTADTSQPYWAADLGSVADISEIRIWNRTDCCSERLSNFYVLVSDTPFDADSLDSQISQPNVTAVYVSELPFESESVTLGSDELPDDLAGRYVRVQLQDAGSLSLAEVEVFGSDDSPTVDAERSLAGEFFVSADELEVGLNAQDEIVTGHWSLSFGEDDTVTWFFSDVAVAGTFSRAGESGTGMIADFGGGFEVAFDFDGIDLIWDSLEYLRTSSSIDSQESLEMFLDGSRFTSVENLDVTQGPMDTLVPTKRNLSFDGDQVTFGVQDTLSAGTLIFNGRSGFRVSFPGGGPELIGVVLDDQRLIFDFDIYESSTRAVPEN